jgi:hypothetical protein
MQSTRTPCRRLVSCHRYRPTEHVRDHRSHSLSESLLKELKAVLRVTLGDGTEHNIVANLGKLGLAS